MQLDGDRVGRASAVSGVFLPEWACLERWIDFSFLVAGT